MQHPRRYDNLFPAGDALVVSDSVSLEVSTRSCVGDLPYVVESWISVQCKAAVGGGGAQECGVFPVNGLCFQNSFGLDLFSSYKINN